jgi:hypothetical protein
LTDAFLFAELTVDALTDGRAFDGMAFGKFRDMLGREVTLDANDAADYVANTRAAIAATTTESGELVGLPIDANNHDKGDAAGWIIGVEAADGGILRLVPKWTAKGRELIGGGVRRFFSATIDVANKVILGGTLTNWPATRDKGGRIMLRPIELSEQLHALDAADSGDFTEASHPIEANESDTADNLNGELTMSDEIRVETPVAPVAEASRPAETPDEAFERIRAEVRTAAFADVADLTQAREQMFGEMKRALEAEYTRLQQQSGQMLAQMMSAIKRENHIAELAQSWTAGNEQSPRGLPIGREEIETFLTGLNPDQLAAAESIFGRIQAQGLINFSEYGHGRNVSRRPLEPEYARLLALHVKAGGDVDEWFSYAGLGAANDYDLSEYEGK